MPVGHTCIVFAPVLFTCRHLLELADFLSINFKILNKNQLIEKLRNALQVSSIANTVTDNQIDLIMNQKAKVLMPDVPRMDKATPPVAASIATSTPTATQRLLLQS